MRNRGPLLTMVAMVGLALALVGLNVAGRPVPAPTPVAAASTPAPPVPPVPPAVPPVQPTPEPPGFAAEIAYAGRTAGNEATVAVAIKDGKAIGYVCDGRKIEAWLQGTATGATLQLAGPRGAAVDATLTGDAVFGQITAAGRTWPFAAAAATAPAGVYAGSVSVRGVIKRIGWTVLQDGTVTGLAADATSVGPAPALDPAARSASLDGVAVRVTSVRGNDDSIG